MCRRAYQLLEPMFVEMVVEEEGQGVFCEEKHWSKVLDMIPDEEIRSKLSQRWSAPSCTSTPVEKWREVGEHVEKVVAKGVSNNKRSQPNESQRKRNVYELRTCIQEIVLAYLYPRLDANVSKQRNHLLKSPFAVHPKTGRVCVPVTVSEIEAFDPFTVPTLGALQEEMNTGKQSTSMQQYIKVFESSLLKPLEREFHQKQRQVQEQDAAMTGDW